MNIEEANLIADTVTAACAVAGIVVAVALGLKSVKISHETANIALETQKRAEKDYLSGRADYIAANLNDVLDQIAQFRAEIHIFWKEVPRDLLEDPAEYELTRDLPTKDFSRNFLEERVVFLDQQRLLAEVGVHGSIYRLNAAGTRLADSVESVEHLPAVVDLHGAGISAESTVAFIKVVLRSVYPHYLTLISEIDLPEPQDDDFEDWFFADLDMSTDTGSERLALDEAERWISEKLKDGTKYSAGELTHNFIEHFAIDRLVQEVSTITTLLYVAAVPTSVAVSHKSSLARKLASS